jgi:hypothetical protein
MSNKAGEERGLYWWVRYVIVPIIGGGGLIAIIVALIMGPSSSLPNTATPPLAQPTSTASDLPSTLTLSWTFTEGHIVLDPDGKYWEMYQDNTDLPGLYLRLKDLSSVSESLGDYLELKADGTFVIEEDGNRFSGRWQRVDANQVTLYSP